MPRPEWVVSPDRLLPLFGARNLDALIDAAFHLLQQALPCDLASAFYRNAGNGLLKQRDSRGRESSVAHMRRHLELNPAIPVALANPGVKVVTTRRPLSLSTRELRKSAFYREIMRVEGWRHSVALCFWGEPRGELPIFVSSVYRSEGEADFSNRDIATLEQLHPFLDCAVNRVYDDEALQVVHDGLAMAVSDGATGFAILDRNLLLTRANPLARRLCAAWVSDDGVAPARRSSPARWQLPPALSTACHELQHEWQVRLRSDPAATGLRRTRDVQHPRIPSLTASITIVCPSPTGLTEPVFLIAFDRRADVVASHQPDRSPSLLESMTPAERGVARVLVDGQSNQEIADRLGKSVSAVKFLLHRIYQKTGIQSRAALVAAMHAR